MDNSMMKHISEVFSLKRMEELLAKPEEEAKRSASKLGEEFAKTIIERMNIKERDVHGIAKIIKIIARNAPLSTVEVESNRVHLKNEGYCPVMTTCLDYNFPWEKMCRIMGWPFFTGLVRAVNPKVEFSSLKHRQKGDPYCDHVFEIKEG